LPQGVLGEDCSLPVIKVADTCFGREGAGTETNWSSNQLVEIETVQSNGFMQKKKKK